MLNNFMLKIFGSFEKFFLYRIINERDNRDTKDNSRDIKDNSRDIKDNNRSTWYYGYSTITGC
jgi:hypothetical protein